MFYLMRHVFNLGAAMILALILSCIVAAVFSFVSWSWTNPLNIPLGRLAVAVCVLYALRCWVKGGVWSRTQWEEDWGR